MKAIDCRDARSSLSEYLDGVLERSSAGPIDGHLSSCAACRAELAALRRTRSLLAEAGSVRAPEAWVREAMRNARRPGQAGRRLSFLTLPAALSTAAAAAVLVVLFATGRLLIRSDAESPAFETLTTEPAPASPTTRPDEPTVPSAERKNDLPISPPATVPVSPAPRGSPAASPSSTTPDESLVGAKSDVKESEAPKSAAPDSARDRGLIDAKPDARGPTGGTGATSSVGALMSQPARQENAAQGPGFPSYRVHLAQIHYPEAKGLDQEGKVTSFAAPAPSIQKTAKSEAARLRAAGEPAHLIRAVAVVDQTGRILSARAVSEDADARTRDFLAGLAGARVDLPALVEAKDGEIEDRPAEGAAARAGTPASIRTSEILLEIVLDTPDPPAPR